MIILKFLSVTEELLIIQDQSRAGFGIFGNSRVLKSYQKRSNLGHSAPSRTIDTRNSLNDTTTEDLDGLEISNIIGNCTY